MPTFQYAKLVRDNIPGFHQQSGHTVKGYRLKGDELKNALCQKLHEEADEVGGALTRDELIEEIGDVQQVIDDLCKMQNIDRAELEIVMRNKADRKGSFSNGEYIDTVTIPSENDEWAKYCRQAPEKYLEVK